MILERRMEGKKIGNRSKKAISTWLAMLLLLASVGGMAGCGEAPTTPVAQAPPPQISEARQPPKLAPDTCGLAVFRQGALFGYLDCNQTVVFPAVWDFAAPFNPDFGFAIVRQAEMYGVINRQGEWTIPPSQTFVQDIGEGYFAVADTQRKGFAILDPQGQRLFPFPFNPVYPFEEGFAMGRVGDKLLLFNPQGHVSAEIPNGRPVKGSPPGMISEGKVAVNVNGYLGYWQVDGKQLTPTEYDQAHPYAQGRARVMKEGKLGYLDERGQMAIPLQYSDGTDFHDGVAGVQLADGSDKGAWQIIGLDGKLISPALFAKVLPFQFGVAWVARRESNRWGLINNQGIGVNLPAFEVPGQAPFDPIYIVAQNGKYGAIATDGSERVPFQYDLLLPFKRNLAEFQQAGKWGLINDHGQVLVPAQYSDVARYANGLFLFLKEGTIQDYFDQQWHFKPEHAVFYRF